DVQRFDDVDLIAGADAIFGGAGDDILHGQRGNDTISGGDGADEIYGELGNDTLSGDAGNDLVMGDVADVTRVFRNGAWHKDVLLTDMAYLAGEVSLGASPSVSTVNALPNAD